MRKYQSSDKREKKLLNRRQRNKKNIISESSEARKTRLLRKRQQEKQGFERETTEHREIRLLNKRKQKKQAINDESDKQKENRLMQKRQKAKVKKAAQGKENCSTIRFKKKTMTLEQLIADFHNSVCQMDQFTFALAVINFGITIVCLLLIKSEHQILMQSNYYRMHVTSVNNAEWLCQTCMKYLKSGKVPPFGCCEWHKISRKTHVFLP